jgi:microcystin-dependent protein
MPYQPNALTSDLTALASTAGNAVADLTGVVAGADVLASQFTDVKAALQDLVDLTNTIRDGGYYTPVGSLMPFAASTVPEGWLACNGDSWATLSMTTGAPLYDLLQPLGYAGVPDLRGRTIIGVGVGTEITGVLNTIQGVKEVTLTSAQSGVPAHSHPITDVAHSHTSRASNGGAILNSGDGFNRGSSIQDPGFANTSSQYTGITGTNNNTAANAASAHTNIQPSLPLYYIIKK